jgi:lipid II:glycine glycyltransferase (peptidoglycan interpeptide bridge formation enzyme)
MTLKELCDKWKCLDFHDDIKKLKIELESAKKEIERLDLQCVEHTKWAVKFIAEKRVEKEQAVLTEQKRIIKIALELSHEFEQFTPYFVIRELEERICAPSNP